MGSRVLASLLVHAATIALISGSPAANAAAAAPADPAPEARSIPTQLPGNVIPHQYKISIVPDAGNLQFSASVLSDVEILEATDRITLNAADLEFDAITLENAHGVLLHPARFSVDPVAQTATFHFQNPLRPGRHKLAIDYRGKINTQPYGFFALDYETAEGGKRSLYTQFQSSDARRLFPGWDEPQYRTPFHLTVHVPAGQDSISNMPPAKSEARPDGSKIVTFEPTPAMSSYLLFLAVGEFDRISTVAAGTEISVLTKKGDGEKGRWALDSSAKVMPWLNDYFGNPYPLPKLDNIAAPGSSQFFGAMENWGAIFSFENFLLDDPSITTEATRQMIFEIAAHETAHQWFGNLVTMAWWDDLWLNEGFASWMATKATMALHPEWQRELDSTSGGYDLAGANTILRGRESAINLDAVAATHPIVQDVASVDEIFQAFDEITYLKGEAVITMLEDYIGEDSWQRGVQDYILTHRFSNTRSDDLWSKIEKAAGKPITAIAHDFTLQPGVPLIRVESAECRSGRTETVLRQTEFTRDRKDKPPLRWRVPVTVSAGGVAIRTVVTDGRATVSVPGCGALVVNRGHSGYFRTLYTPDRLNDLTARFPDLEPIDQIGLLADNWGLGLAGYQAPGKALDMIDAVPDDANPGLYRSVATILEQIYLMYDRDPQRRAKLTRYASAKFSPVLTRIGWMPKPEEAATTPALRARLIGALGMMGDPVVVAEAKRLYVWGAPLATQGQLRTTILSIVASDLDEDGWTQLRDKAKIERNPLVREQLYAFLGSAREPALARRSLALALTDEPGATTSAIIVAAVAARHPELTYDFALQHRTQVEGLVESSSRSGYVTGLSKTSADPAMIAKLEDFARLHMNQQTRRPVDVVIAAIRERVKTRETALADISQWLDTKND